MGARQDKRMKESAEVAVGRLFEEHGARLYRLGVRFCGSTDEAHDLVQAVLGISQLEAVRRPILGLDVALHHRGPPLPAPSSAACR